MLDGPYRHIEIERQVPPRGIKFFGNDEGLSVEVRRPLPTVVTGAGLIAVGATVVFARQWADLMATLLTFNGFYLFWPRLRKAHRVTTIELRGVNATFTESGFFAPETHVIPLARLGPPLLREIEVERRQLRNLRLRSLQFDHYVDGVRGGQSLPLHILVGYDADKLEWLRKNILAWMTKYLGAAA
jgi:hypothetical protein